MELLDELCEDVKMKPRGWRDGSEFKSMRCPCRGLEFGQAALNLLELQLQGTWHTFSGLCGPLHSRAHTSAPNTRLHVISKKLSTRFYTIIAACLDLFKFSNCHQLHVLFSHLQLCGLSLSYLCLSHTHKVEQNCVLSRLLSIIKQNALSLYNYNWYDSQTAPVLCQLCSILFNFVCVVFKVFRFISP